MFLLVEAIDLTLKIGSVSFGLGRGPHSMLPTAGLLPRLQGARRVCAPPSYAEQITSYCSYRKLTPAKTR